MTKWAITFIAVAALLCGAAFAVKEGISAVAGMVKDAGDTARDERDAHYAAEIAKSNAEVADMRAAQAEKVTAIDADAQDKIALAERQLVELRKDSDVLQDDGSCGLSLGRVQLLDR